jgi:K+-sensing histidine kinase KdpD
MLLLRWVGTVAINLLSGIRLIQGKFIPITFNQGVERETRQGLGLGLTIIKNYVTRMKGTLRVKSVEGKGSSFLICLPIKSVEKQMGKQQ